MPTHFSMNIFQECGPTKVFKYFDPKTGEKIHSIKQATLLNLKELGFSSSTFLDKSGLDADERYPLARVTTRMLDGNEAVLFSHGGLICLRNEGLIARHLQVSMLDWDDINNIHIHNNQVFAEQNISLFPFYSINKLSDLAKSIFDIKDSIESWSQLQLEINLADDPVDFQDAENAQSQYADILNGIAKYMSGR